MDILVEALSWNLWIVLPWKQRSKYHFKLWFYPDLREGVGLLHRVATIFNVLRNLHTVFLVAAPTHFHPHPQCRRPPCSPRALKHWIFVDVLGMVILRGWADTLLQFDWHFSNSDAEHLFIGFMAISMPSLRIHPFRSLANFFSWVDCILILICRRCLHILEMNTLL